MTLGSAAGKSGGELGPALPAAATSTIPLPLAFAKASRRRGSEGPAKLILITRAPCAAAQSRPLRNLYVVPSALSARPPNACTVSSPTPGAVPSMFRRAAIAPAIPVP